MLLKDLPTYVYIDASNIRNALRSFDIKLDFKKLAIYLSKKYENLVCIKYFEGVDKNNPKAIKKLKSLENFNYSVKTLERKAYFQAVKFKYFECFKCRTKNKVKISKSKKVMKSNVDVYLCSEFMSDLLNKKKPAHVIIFSCDGDYAEMIKEILNVNENIYISVFATPFRKKNNYLSVRLKELEKINRFYLVNILSIKDKIKK